MVLVIVLLLVKQIITLYHLAQKTLTKDQHALVNLYKIAYYFSDITVVASRATHRVNPENPKYTTLIQEQFSNIPIFLFHTPDDPKYLQELMDDPLVRVILVGAGQSIDRFDISNCSQKASTNN